MSLNDHLVYYWSDHFFDTSLTFMLYWYLQKLLFFLEYFNGPKQFLIFPLKAY